MKNKKLIIILIISIVLIGIFSIVSGNGIIIREKKIIKEMNESTQVTELNSQITNLNKEHEDYLNYIQTCKTQIATALTNEGVSTSNQITLEEMATNIPKILQARTSDATASAEDIAQGETAYVNGNKITGTGVFDISKYELVEQLKLYAGSRVGSTTKKFTLEEGNYLIVITNPITGGDTTRIVFGSYGDQEISIDNGEITTINVGSGLSLSNVKVNEGGATISTKCYSPGTSSTFLQSINAFIFK